MAPPPPPPRVALTGVAGVGKTTVGQALARVLGVPFVDADDLHTPANRARMAAGIALTDADREPWLDAVAAAAAAATQGIVLACSALKASYRERLARQAPTLRFVQLVADRHLLQRRLAARRDHFFPATLLDSQLQTLEPLQQGLVLDATAPVADLVRAVCDHLRPPAG